MRPFSLVLLIFFFLLALVPARLLAKTATTRITIEGNHLRFEITNPGTLAQFNIWSGPGTSSHQSQSFIVDWSRPLASAPRGLPRYQVSFYGRLAAEQTDDRLIYVVSYAYDADSGRGYVYLPGGADPGYALDVSTIHHGVEGTWFHAWSMWDHVAGPLLNCGLAAMKSVSDRSTCFAIRRYLAKRRAANSDVTDIVGVSTCLPSRNVEIVSEPARFPDSPSRPEK